jgi:ribose/xylose/arabinose/galactoside ABC-type transport system permease subunit
MACTMALAICVLLGLWNGFLVSVIGIQPIIATLVLMVAGRGLAMLVTDGQYAVPRRATELGYRHEHPQLDEALRSALRDT